MSETAKQRKEREEREAAEAATAPKANDKTDGKDAAPAKVEQKDATVTPEPIRAKAAAHEPGGEPPEDRDQQTSADTATAPAGTPAQGGSVSHDRPAGSDVTLAGPVNPNAASFQAGEQRWAAEQTLRGGGPVAQPTFPQAPSREQQEDNASELAAAQAANMTGTDDGVSSVYPQVAGPTNMALTPAQVFSRLDDGAVDERGRLAGTYYDDLQEEEQARRRERIEGRTTTDASRAAAGRIRELASSPAIPAADLGRPADQQGLVDGRKHTGHGNPNDRIRRAREVTDAHQTAPGSTAR